MNDRLKISMYAMQGLLANPNIVRPKEGPNKESELNQFVDVCVEYADALIAAAGEGDKLEIPTSHFKTTPASFLDRKLARSLIETIHVNETNFEHIAMHKIINGTLLKELERVMMEYASKLAATTSEIPTSHSDNLDYITKHNVWVIVNSYTQDPNSSLDNMVDALYDLVNRKGRYANPNSPTTSEIPNNSDDVPCSSPRPKPTKVDCCDHDYVYKILHDHTGVDVCTKCSHTKMHSKPEPIKSDWSFKTYFRIMQNKDGSVNLSQAQQDEICDLVEKYYGKPASVPSVQEFIEFLNEYSSSVEIIRDAEALHQWLTERNNPK